MNKKIIISILALALAYILINAPILIRTVQCRVLVNRLDNNDLLTDSELTYVKKYTKDIAEIKIRTCESLPNLLFLECNNPDMLGRLALSRHYEDVLFNISRNIK